MVDPFSWWFGALVAWVLVHHYETDLIQGKIQRAAHNRRLQDESAAAVPTDDGPRSPITVGKGGTMYISIPCFTMLSPCGNVTVPPAGVDVTGPLGIGGFHVPGQKALSGELHDKEADFTYITVTVVIALASLWLCATCCFPPWRDHAYKKVSQTISPPDDEDDSDDDATPEEKEKEKKAQLDPESKDFIAPGNIYRLLAVLHPGVVGYVAWGKFAFKAAICAYMQLFLPYSIIKGIFKEWAILGVKSPVWFALNAMTFITMFAALGSLCSLFQGRCAKSMEDGLHANFYILTHKGPGGARSPAPGGGVAFKGASSFGPTAIRVNEMFWCVLSMLMNISMSLMLQLCMFLKIATFQGAVDQVAVVAVSLYFIDGLDDKVMRSDPKLRPRYRRAVAKQTEEREGPKPKWLKTLAFAMIGVSSAAVPVGLLCIILLSWQNQNTGVVIGGSGL